MCRSLLEEGIKGKVGPTLEGKLINIEGLPKDVGYVASNPLDVAYWRISRVKDSLKRILERRSFRGETGDGPEVEAASEGAL